MKVFDLRLDMERAGRIIGYIIAGLILLIALSFFVACGDDSPARVIVTDPAPPVEPGPEPPDNEPVQIAAYTDTSLKFYDGASLWTWKDGKTCRAESGIYSSGNVLCFLDAYGDVDTSRALVVEPDAVALDGADTWIIENIDPETAYSMGALYKDYTRVYKNAVEIGHWYDRQYKSDRLVIHNGDAFARSTVGAWYHLNGTKTGVRIAIPDGFAIWNYNGTAKTATIDGTAVSWTLNFFNGAAYWLNAGTTWYSQNGYSWNGAALVESGLVMSELRSVQNVIISAGSRYENSEDVLYWLNCATGWVIRHVPSTNQRTDHVRLYTGDGTTETGLYYKELVKPVIAGNHLYFIFDAQVYRYNFVTGLTALFTSGVSEIFQY